MSPLALTPAERATLRESGEFIVQYVIPQTVGTIFWGIYLAIASKAFTILWCKGIRNSRPRAVLLVTIILMFLLSTTLLLVSWAEFFIQVSFLFLGTGNFSTLEDRLLATDVYKYQLYFAYLLIFQIEVLLGDSIVIWRTWAIWSDTRRIVIFPMMLWLSSLVLLIVSASILTEYDYIYTASQAVSIVANGLATALIAYRAWSHRHMLKLVGCSPSTLTEKILALLVESGCIYLFMVNSWSIFINSFDSIVAQTLGLYPTVIILVEGRKTAWDDNTPPHRASTTIVLTSNMGSSINPIESDWEMGSTRQTRSWKSDS